MTERASAGPNVAWTDVEDYLNKGQDVTIPLAAATARPQVSYVIADGGHDIALHVQLGPHQHPPRSTLPVIRIDQIAERGLRMARIRTTQAAFLRDFHDMLCAVADRIVTHHRTLDQAFEETVRAWSALLNRPHALSLERRLGLIGELAVLAAIAESSVHNWSAAVDSWIGPESEEHDFGLPGCDIEVKTTSSEKRRHTINGSGQLSPAPGRPLWFLSLQLTRGGAHGRTLSDCANAVRKQVAEYAPAVLTRFDAKLGSAGWSADIPDDERWSIRSEPLIVTVDDSFPRLDDTLMDSIPEPLRARIDSVQYCVDLTGLPPAVNPPSALHAIRLP